MAETIITGFIDQARKKAKLPLGFKLAFIVALILMGSIWAMTSLMSLMVRSQLAKSAEDSNFAFNSRAAAGIEERLYRIRSGAFSLLDMDMAARDSNSLMALRLRNIFFERNPYIAAVVIPGVQVIINQQFFENNGIPEDFLPSWLEKEASAIESAEKNVPVLRNAAQDLGINLLALFYPWQSTGFEESAVIFFSPQNLSEITAAGPSSTMVVNGDGDILIHPDFSRVLAGDNVSGTLFFAALDREPGETVRIIYTDGGNRYIAAGHRISLADAAVFSTLEYSLINKQLSDISRRNILLSLIVLFFAILVTWFYAKSITNPVRRLIEATGRIRMGEFYLDLKRKSRDELGELTERFISMGEGLSQFEETKDLVGHFNDRDIIDRAMRGELKLEGEYLQAVILSVDFGSFSEISEKMKAQDSLELLNSFFAKTINCIERGGGVVDKIIGSRVIALWGVLRQSGELTGEVLKCLQTALMMRSRISETNSDREESKQPLIRMACGIHTGQVLAGRIGAFRYNKYSVTGNSVNNAIKYGELCVPAQTDIVISGEVQDMAADSIIAEKLKPGKSLGTLDKGVKLYGLVNLKAAQDEDKQKGPATLDEVRELLGFRVKVQTNGNRDDEAPDQG